MKGLAHFNAVVDSIVWTDNYPKEGIRFADMSRTFGLPALGKLAAIVVRNLGIETGQVIVGVPTRGCTWASVLAMAADAPAFSLSKKGVGTPLPDHLPLCASGTVYSEKASAFTASPADIQRFLSADIVWVADDVCESGKTMQAVCSALATLGCADVRAIPLMVIDQHPNVYGIIEYISADRRCYPGRQVFSIESLFTMRGNPRTMDRDSVNVLCMPSMNTLAIQYGRAVGDMQWDEFPGGMPNVQFQCPNMDIFFIYDASLMSTTQDGVVHALARNCKGHMTVFIPYLPQGTMERVDQEGVLATAQTTLHSLCASMPLTAKGPVIVQIVDVHQTGTRFYTTDRVQYQPISVLSKLVPEQGAIAFPDDGACKRFKHLFPHRVLYVFSKIRQGGKRVIRLTEIIGEVDADNHHVTIVDDLTRTGGTILNTARVLREEYGMTHVTACFVHADLDPGRSIPFARSPLLDAIVCTDSCPQKAHQLQLANRSKVCVKPLFNHPLRRPNFLVLASESPEKIDALMHVPHAGRWDMIYCGPVPSGVSPQPVGDAEIMQGVRNRAAFVKHLAPDAEVLAPESGLVPSLEKGYLVDRVYVGEEAFADSSRAIPEALLSEAPAEVGVMMQERHNLPTKSAWLGDRSHQIARAMQKQLQ